MDENVKEMSDIDKLSKHLERILLMLQSDGVMTYEFTQSSKITGTTRFAVYAHVDTDDLYLLQYHENDVVWDGLNKVATDRIIVAKFEKKSGQAVAIHLIKGSDSPTINIDDSDFWTKSVSVVKISPTDVETQLKKIASDYPTVGHGSTTYTLKSFLGVLDEINLEFDHPHHLLTEKYLEILKSMDI